MRRKTQTVTEKMLEDAIAHCDERLSQLEELQTEYQDADIAKNQPGVTKSYRRFREEHFAFLNAAYSLGDMLKRAVVRQYARSELNPFFEQPLTLFHRDLRNALDHGHSLLDFGLTINVTQSVVISPPTTFPVPDIPTAAAHGMLNVEQTPVAFGTRFFVYRNEHLSQPHADLLDVMRAGSKEEPSVLRLAQTHLVGLSLLCRRAVRESRMKPAPNAGPSPE